MAAPVALKLANLDMVGSPPGGGSSHPKSPTTPTSPLAKLPSPFVNLNVRQVFESNGVEETKEISKRVNVEIEKKREELRTLVGERYRDLIDAADTIALMSTNSASIFGKLGSLRQKMSVLPTQLSSLARPQVSSEENENFLNQSELEIAFELKLSLEGPRVVQRLLDDRHVIQATHVGLLFEKYLSQKDKPYRWTFLGGNAGETNEAIKSLILDACSKIIEDFSSPPEQLAECIAVQQILQKLACSEVIANMLTKRIAMCDNLLESGDDMGFVAGVGVTLHEIYKMFIDGQLYSLAAKEMRRPAINVNSFGVKYTPKVIESFQKESISVEDSPRAGALAEILLSSFVHPLKGLLVKGYDTKKYLVDQQSFEELSNYAKFTTTSLKEQTDDIMRLVLGTSSSLWKEAFYPVFLKKCEAVVSQKISLFFQYLEEEAFPKHKKLDDDFDLVSYIWKGASVKSPASVTSSKDVDLKLKCLSPQIADICGEIEQGLAEFLRDFQTLGDFSLKKFISVESLQKWKDFLSSVSTHSETLFLARFTASLIHLSPTVWKLMDIKDGSELRQLFTEIGDKCWNKWSLSSSEKFYLTLSSKMETDNFPGFIPVAEEFTPEGEEQVKPSVRIPIQISHLLHSCLFGLCHELSTVGPQSIPKSVREDFRQGIGFQVMKVYDKLISESTPLSPQTALQLIFDIKFCQWFHLQLKEQSDPLLKRLEAVIDPFDLDIVGGKLKTNLKRFLFETHLTLGLLFSEESHSFIAQNFKTKINLSFPISNPSLSCPLPLLPV